MSSDPVAPAKPPRAGDLNIGHLEWLVKNRSRNQRATLRLYRLLRKRRKILDKNVVYEGLVEELAGIAFSLWRAVFLSDLSDDPEAQLIHVSQFLGTLISTNAIAFQQDRQARNWTFPYYLANARLRLTEIAARSPHLIDFRDIDIVADSAKQDWLIAQTALEKAIAALEKLLTQASGSKT